jgi:hypothetical protein
MHRPLAAAREVIARSFAHSRCRHDLLLMRLPVAERIVINDTKPGGLQAAVALNVPRDKGMRYE